MRKWSGAGADLATLQGRRVSNSLPGFPGQLACRIVHFVGNIDRDGRFRIDDLPPGHYELIVPIDFLPRSDPEGRILNVAQVKIPVDVPEGDDDVPVDLGDIEAPAQGR